MARSINQVILMGRLTRDPEQRTTTSGRTVVSFSIAVDRQTQDDQADFFDVTAWEKLGWLCSTYQRADAYWYKDAFAKTAGKTRKLASDVHELKWLPLT